MKQTTNKFPTFLTNICSIYAQMEVEAGNTNTIKSVQKTKSKFIENAKRYHESMTFSNREGYRLMMRSLIEKYHSENTYIMMSMSIDKIVLNSSNRFILSFYLGESKPMESDELLSKVYFHVRQLLLDERYEEFYEMANYFEEFKKMTRQQRNEYEKFLKVHANNKPMYLQYINSNWSAEHFKSFFKDESEHYINSALKYRELGIIDLDDYLSPDLCYKFAYHIFEQLNDNQQ